MEGFKYVSGTGMTVPVAGFFDGWQRRPSQGTFDSVLANSTHVILAKELATDQIVGFVSCITDRTLSAYIPFIEVLETHRGRGIGTSLMRELLAELSSVYMVDLICDPALQAFYERFGMRPSLGMSIRNYNNQDGKAHPNAN